MFCYLFCVNPVILHSNIYSVLKPLPCLHRMESILGAAAFNNQGMTVLVIILLLLLFLSFCAAGSEVAFFSLTYKDINLLKTKQQQAYKRVIDLLENPKILLASLQIAKITINVFIVVIGNYLVNSFLHLPDAGDFFIKLLLIAAVIILFCEVLPKLYANYNSIRFAKDFGFVAEGLYLVFNRVGNIIVQSSEATEKKIAGKKNNYSSEEISHAIDKTYPEGKVEEKDILLGILKFGTISVKQVMRTRLDVCGIEYDTPFNELISQVENLHYSRLPVYKNNLDKMEGMLHTKDLLAFIDEEASFDWHRLIRPSYFVHEHKLIEDLLQEFRQKHIHFAIVVDEFGGTSGIVSLEDIIEEIIGDIHDEFDEEEASYKKLDDNNYLFDGSVMINDVSKIMHLPEDTFEKVKGESDSLAGLVLEIAGYIPEANMVVTAGDFDFTVLEAERNRLQKIKVTIKPQEAK